MTRLASSKSGPKNSTQRVEAAAYLGWRTNSAEVTIPSVPSFCSPGRPPSTLLVMSFQRPGFRISAPESSTVRTREPPPSVRAKRSRSPGRIFRNG